MALRRAGQLGCIFTRCSSAQPAGSHATNRGLTTAALPDLDYDYGELQPVISARIMELHHSKHHAAYVTNFNKAQETYADAEAKGDIAKMIALQGALKFNGGGMLWGYVVGVCCGLWACVQLIICRFMHELVLGTTTHRARESRVVLEEPDPSQGTVHSVLSSSAIMHLLQLHHINHMLCTCIQHPHTYTLHSHACHHLSGLCPPLWRTAGSNRKGVWLTGFHDYQV